MRKVIEFTYGEMRREAKRELRRRLRDYPNKIAKHRLTNAKAARQMALMEAIYNVLRELEKTELLI